MDQIDYTLRYRLAWAVAFIGVIAGALAGARLIGLHPSWLTDDVAFTSGIVSGVCTALAAKLPDTGRTPDNRLAVYNDAYFGKLPADVHEKLGLPERTSPADIPPAGASSPATMNPSDTIAPVAPPLKL